MTKAKREEFLEEINGNSGIHTMLAVADEVDKQKAHDCVCVSEPVKRKDKNMMRINCNKGAVYYTEKAIITCFSEFLSILLSVLNEICAVGVRITRADFAINMFSKNAYYKYEKPIGVIIRCVGNIEGIKDNCYHSEHMNKKVSLTHRISSNSIEMENYNKEIESKGKVPATNRLELRTKNIRAVEDIETVLKNEVMIKWIDRLQKITNEVYREVQKECNDTLIRLYKEDEQKPKQERKYISVSAFILANEEMIYTRQQLRELYKQIEPNCNSDIRVKKFCDRHKIELYSNKDIQIIRDGLINEIKRFFES